MTPARTSARTRTLVLAVHLAALGGGCAYAWGQWSDLAAQRDAVEQTRATVAQLDRRLATGGVSLSPAAPPRVDPFLPGASLTVAAANLQDRVVSTIRTAGGTVTSSQVDTGSTEAGTGPKPPPGAAGAPPVVLLTVSCQLAGGGALQRLLYALEDGAPAVFLDQLTVESQARAPGDTLKITMVVSAYWSGEATP